jgi:hypothetical protein
MSPLLYSRRQCSGRQAGGKISRFSTRIGYLNSVCLALKRNTRDLGRLIRTGLEQEILDLLGWQIELDLDLLETRNPQAGSDPARVFLAVDIDRNHAQSRPIEVVSDG